MGQLAAVHLCDAHYITDASKYISVLLLSLRAMLHLELPHINVLSKIDLISQYGDLGTLHSLPISRTDTLYRIQLGLLHRSPRPIIPRKLTLLIPPTAIRRLKHGHDITSRRLQPRRIRNTSSRSTQSPSPSQSISLTPSLTGQKLNDQPNPRHRPRNGVHLRPSSLLKRTPGYDQRHRRPSLRPRKHVRPLLQRCRGDEGAPKRC